MLSYDTLDGIADAYIPLLIGLWALLVIVAGVRHQWQPMGWRVIFGLATLLVAYGFMWLDGALRLWSVMQMDYSTHTAVASALVLVLAVSTPRWRILAALSLLAYFALMLYQRYHTVADIASTLFAIAPGFGLIAWRLRPTVQAPTR